MSERLDRFVDLMKGIFELDKSDLDFGIYRIMNIRKAEIEKFLTEGLPAKVTEILIPFAQNDTDDIKAKNAAIEEQAAAFGITDISQSPKAAEYNALKAQLAGGTDLAALEADVYSALYNFFGRYYDEGDFISKRRYKEGVYAIPYEGEEVKLYWANQDQYYIKTSENFKDYTFKVDDYTVHFRIVDATTEQNNNKESDDSKRVFMLFTEDEENFPGIKTFEHNADTKEIIIRFVYDIPADKKIKYKEENYKAVHNFIYSNNKTIPVWNDLLAPVPTGKGKDTTNLLEKHMNAYVAKNTFDYFIHKDLKGFLYRELDFFIKNEVLHIDDIDVGDDKRFKVYLSELKAIKDVGHTIIDFLAQIENFQKKLWLKKKFVIETNWCITLDRIDEKFYPEIIANRAQIQEWIDMYAIDEIERTLDSVGYSDPLTEDFLLQNQNLVVDTKHFSDDFKQRLIASIEELDENTGGVMINSDNYHAINLLKNRYQEKIDCIYIDPPYNAQSSEILYKNTFKHSAWLTLLHNRVLLSKFLLKPGFKFICAIDEVEQEKLGILLSDLFDMNYYGKTCVTIVHNPSGQQGDNFSSTHEYAYFIYPIPGRSIAEQERDNPEEWDKRNLRDVTGDSSLREAGKTCFYPILIKEDKVIGFGEICPNDFHPAVNVQKENGIIEVYPVDPQGIERKWRFGRDTIDSIKDQLIVNYISNRGIYDIQRLKKTFNYKTVWQAAKYSANNYGTQVLNPMFGFQPFSYPKSIFTVQECITASMYEKSNGIILDFFAGSGTTGHATLLTNKENNTSYKYILVEMGEYFDDATIKRIKKSVYCVNTKGWKDGKPQTRGAGVSHIMKYMKLESYEDALSNIQLSEEKHTLASLLGEDYLINYMLDIEAEGSLLNIDAFRSPFDYKLKITENNETKEKNIDVIETFNYLIGLAVSSMSATVYFDAKKAAKPEYEGAVELVKNNAGMYGFRQIEGTDPDGKRVLVIWRTISDNLPESNAALDAYFTKHRINPQDREYDIIYVNGDNNLQNLQTAEDMWKVQMTETEFKKRMFEEK